MKYHQKGTLCIVAFLCFFLLYEKKTLGQQSQDSVEDSGKWHFDKVKEWYRKDLDSAKWHALKALENYEHRSDSSMIGSCLNALTSIHYYQGQMVEAIEYARKSYELLRNNPLVSKKKVITAANNTAVMMQELGNSLGALKLLEEVQRDMKVMDVSDPLKGAVHQNLGNNYSILGDYYSAQYHLVLARHLVDSADRVPILLALCSNAIRGRSFSEAQGYLNEIKIGEEDKGYTSVIFERLSSLLAMHEGHYQVARTKLCDLLDVISESDWVERIRTLNLLGELCLEMEDYQQALYWFEYASDLNKVDLTAERKVFQMEALRGRAISNARLGHWDAARGDWERAFSTNFLELGEKKEILRHDLQWQLIFSKIKAMADVMKEDEILQLYKEAVVSIHESRKNLLTYSSRLNNSATSRDVFDAYIDFLANMYLKNSKVVFSEMKNAIIDAHSITFKESMRFHSLLRKQSDEGLKKQYFKITQKLNELMRQHPELTSFGGASDDIALQDTVLGLLDRRRQIKDNFFWENGNSNELGMSKMASLYNALLIYKSENKYYFLHDYGKEGLIVLKTWELDSLVHDLHLGHVGSGAERGLTQKLYELTQRIFPDFSIFQVDKLVVLPDGAFNALPLEILPKNPPEKYPLHQVHFLGQDVVIEYVHQFQSEATRDRQRSLLSIAPRFSDTSVIYCGGEKMSPLFCNEREAEYAEKYFSGSILNQEKLNVSQVVEEIRDHDIIHFSTHICVDTSRLYNHVIQLADQPMFSSDLFYLDWHKKSVVLSACESGIGRNKLGEGSLSFSRWLLELGSSEVLATYWPIDDCMTAEFMKGVFKNWAKKENLSHALFAARKEYLNTVEDFGWSPLEWGPFVVMRNGPSISMQKGSKYRYVVVGGGLLMLVLFICVFVRQVISRI